MLLNSSITYDKRGMQRSIAPIYIGIVKQDFTCNSWNIRQASNISLYNMPTLGTSYIYILTPQIIQTELSYNCDFRHKFTPTSNCYEAFSFHINNRDIVYTFPYCNNTVLYVYFFQRFRRFSNLLPATSVNI